MIREVRAVMKALRHRADRFAALSGPRAFGVAGAADARRSRLLANRIAGARGTQAALAAARPARAQSRRPKSTCSTAPSPRPGCEFGVPTPVNAVYARVLSDIAHTPPLWAKYREHPDRSRPRSQPK